MLGARRRIALLAEGHFAPMDAKTAVGVLRYRPDEVVCVIDSTRAGRTAAECVGVGGDRPVVADVESAAARGADTLLVGIAPQGAACPTTGVHRSPPHSPAAGTCSPDCTRSSGTTPSSRRWPRRTARASSTSAARPRGARSPPVAPPAAARSSC